MTQVDYKNKVASSSERRWLYGFNVAVLIFAALVIVGFVGYLTTRWTFRKDWTSGGLYSLSGSTKKLLAEAASKNKTYELISLFPPSADSDQRQQVLDALEEYARTSSAIKVRDASEMTQDEIEKRIRDLYAGELKPYEETVSGFDPLAEELIKFLKGEAANIGAVGQKPGTPEDVVEEATIFQGSLDYGFPKQVEEVRTTVRRYTDSTSPEWTAATDAIKRLLEGRSSQAGGEGIIRLLETMGDVKKLRASPQLSAYLASAAPRYKEIVGKLNAYKDRINKLPPLKVAEILGALKRNTIIIIGPSAAKVIPESDIFKFQPPAGPSQEPTSQFQGEQAISSAILSLERPEKVKVVFITTSPSHPTSSQFSEITRELEIRNFEVLEWSPPGPPMGGPPPDPVPPAQGKGVVWVVFPPEPPNMQMMRMGMPPPNPAPVIEAAKAHLEAGGQVLFLAEAATEMAMMMRQGEGYPYQPLIKDFGIDVQTKYSLVRQLEGRHPVTGQLMRMTNPAVQITRYSDHPITRSMQSLETVFAPLRAQSGVIGIPTVVRVSPSLPQGTEAMVIIETPNRPDMWGESSLAQDSVFNKESDVAAPVPLAVAAVRNKGQEKEQRIVAIGSSVFGANPFLEQGNPMLVGNRIVEVPAYPGNTELFVNSVLWLAGYENMIDVSAKTSAALRIADIAPGKLLAIRLGFFYLGMPIAALVLGAVVWFIRRK